MGDDNDLTPEQFANWLHPREVLTAFKNVGGDTAVSAIAHRMQDGYIRTAARRVTFNKGKREYFELLPQVWKGWSFLDHDPVWDMGDTIVYPYLQNGQVEIRIYDLRLDPRGVMDEFTSLIHDAPDELLVRMMPLTFTILMDRDPGGIGVETPDRPEPVRSQQVGEKVSQRELNAWAKSYLSGRHGLVHKEIEDAAKEHFSPRRVTRQPLRTAIKSASYPVKAGNPAIRRNSTGE